MFFRVKLYCTSILWGYNMEFLRQNRKLIISIIIVCFLLWTAGSMLFMVMN